MVPRQIVRLHPPARIGAEAEVEVLEPALVRDPVLALAAPVLWSAWPLFVQCVFGDTAIEYSVAGRHKKGRISSVSYATTSITRSTVNRLPNLTNSSAVQGLCHLKRFVDARGDAHD